jgi:hypothetical protein
VSGGYYSKASKHIIIGIIIIILKYKDNRNTAHVEFKNKSDTSNNRDNWNHVKIIKKVPE